MLNYLGYLAELHLLIERLGFLFTSNLFYCHFTIRIFVSVLGVVGVLVLRNKKKNEKLFGICDEMR